MWEIADYIIADGTFFPLWGPLVLSDDMMGICT